MDLITLAMANIVPDTSVEFTATVVIAGIVIVVAMLVLLIIIFQIFGKIVSKSEPKGSKKANAKKVEDAPIIVESTPASAPATNGGVTGEIVAAISAAIYQLEGEGAVVTSITPAVAAPVSVRRQNPITCRNPWAQAAVVENTMSF